MTDNPEESIDWSEFNSYSSSSAAEIDAGYLRSEGIQATVTDHFNLPGLPGKAILWIDRSQFEKARWHLKFPAVTEAELEYLATGELPNPKDQS